MLRRSLVCLNYPFLSIFHTEQMKRESTKQARSISFYLNGNDLWVNHFAYTFVNSGYSWHGEDEGHFPRLSFRSQKSEDISANFLNILSSAVLTWKRAILPQESLQVFFIFFEFSRISYLLYQISHVLRLGKYFDGNFSK